MSSDPGAHKPERVYRVVPRAMNFCSVCGRKLIRDEGQKPICTGCGKVAFPDCTCERYLPSEIIDGKLYLIRTPSTSNLHFAFHPYMVRLTSADINSLGLHSFDDIIEIVSPKQMKGYARATMMTSSEEDDLSGKCQIYPMFVASLGIDMSTPESTMRSLSMGYDEEISLKISKYDHKLPPSDAVILTPQQPPLMAGVRPKQDNTNEQLRSPLSDLERYRTGLFLEGFPVWNGMYVVALGQNTTRLFKIKSIEPGNNPCLLFTSQTKFNLE